MQNKIAVVGATGKLGAAILEELKNHPDFLLDGAYTHPLSKKITPSIQTNLEKSSADIWLDVSLPDTLYDTIQLAKEKKIPLVIGSTGLKEIHFEAMKQAADTIAILYTPNFSLGMTILAMLCKQAAPLISGDVSIIETHRKEKKDAPSGSSKLIASCIESNSKCKPSIHSIRAKDVLGDHEIKIYLDGEVLSLSHSIQTRRAFAKGAIDACRFTLLQKPGLYSMQDMLYSVDRHEENSSRQDSNRIRHTSCDALRPLCH